MINLTEHVWTLRSSGGQKITRVEIIDNGHAIRYYTVHENSNDMQQNMSEFERLFPLVEVERISLNDGFMKYNPNTPNQERVKSDIIAAKNSQMKNFRRAGINPYLNKDGKTITFDSKDAERTIAGKTPEWWDKAARKFMPQKRSRLGSVWEYDVFLGTVIKMLVEKENYSIEEAWRFVCDTQNSGSVKGFPNKRGKHVRKDEIGQENMRLIVKSHMNNRFAMIVSNSSVSKIELPNTVYIRSVGWLVMDA